MAFETTFVMLKPGVLQRRLVGEVLSRFERKGLVLTALRLLCVDTATAELHYAEHREKPFYPSLIAYITSGPVVALAFKGENAISLVRTLCGSTRVEHAQPGTIRGDFALRTTTNIVHASDSPESAARELALYFSAQDFVEWRDGNYDFF